MKPKKTANAIDCECVDGVLVCWSDSKKQCEDAMPAGKKNCVCVDGGWYNCENDTVTCEGEMPAGKKNCQCVDGSWDQCEDDTPTCEGAMPAGKKNCQCVDGAWDQCEDDVCTGDKPRDAVADSCTCSNGEWTNCSCDENKRPNDTNVCCHNGLWTDCYLRSVTPEHASILLRGSSVTLTANVEGTTDPVEWLPIIVLDDKGAESAIEWSTLVTRTVDEEKHTITLEPVDIYKEYSTEKIEREHLDYARTLVVMAKVGSELRFVKVDLKPYLPLKPKDFDSVTDINEKINKYDAWMADVKDFITPGSERNKCIDAFVNCFNDKASVCEFPLQKAREGKLSISTVGNCKNAIGCFMEDKKIYISAPAPKGKSIMVKSKRIGICTGKNDLYTVNLKKNLAEDEDIRVENTTLFSDSEIAKSYGKGELHCSYNASTETYDVYYNEETANVFNRDMYLEYVQPKMYRDKNGEYHATRASVLAAARFLVLQFPKDIPYTSNHIYERTNLTNKRTATGVSKITDKETLIIPYNLSTLSKYLWTTTAKESKENNYDDGMHNNKLVHGLNIINKVYNNSGDDSTVVLGEKEQNKVVPWGCPIKSNDNNDIQVLIDSSGDYLNGDDYRIHYPYNGLHCSSYVTWTFRNGRFNLGGWTTAMFAWAGVNKNDNTPCRAYKCDNGKAWDGDPGNAVSSFEQAPEKLVRLEETDFIRIKDIKIDDIKTGKIKAGDLLWEVGYDPNKDENDKDVECVSKTNGECNFSACKNAGGGHVAMILGIIRGSQEDGSDTELYVGEAIASSGNHLKHYSLKELKEGSADDTWVEDCDDNRRETRLIKMKNVYNYEENLENSPIPKDVDLDDFNYHAMWWDE